MNTIIEKTEATLSPATRKALLTAASLIREGGLVVFPTETVYGLGGNGLLESAARKIYEAKGRPSDNPLILHVAFPEDAAELAYLSPMFYELAEKFMPGPLTVIERARPIVPKTVTAGLPTVAIRCPCDPVAHELLKLSGVPIAAPSANLSGSPSPTCGAHVIEDLRGRVDMILDGGDTDFGVESTIVKIEEDGGLTLLRPGGVTLEELKTVTENIKVAPAVFSALKEGETVLSPGMKYKHYAPKTQTYLLQGTPADAVRYVKEKSASEKAAVLAYEEDATLFSAFLPEERVIVFGKRADTRTQAHRLFYLLREADKLGADAIYAPLPDTDGMGMALYNRMIRAAAHRIITV